MEFNISCEVQQIGAITRRDERALFEQTHAQACGPSRLAASCRLFSDVFYRTGLQGCPATRSIEEQPMTDKMTPNGGPPAMNPVHCRAVMGLRRAAQRRRFLACARLIVERVKRSDNEADPADWRWRSPLSAV